MADESSSPATGDPNSQKPGPTTPIPNSSQTPPPQVAALDPTQKPVFQPGPPYTPPSQIPGSLVPGLPPPPPFRPVMQFPPVPNFQNPNSGVPPPGVSSGGVMAAPGSMPTYQQQLQNPAGMRPFQPMANGYPGIHAGGPPPGSMPPPAS